jgi:hypothetical protein
MTRARTSTSTRTTHGTEAATRRPALGQTREQPRSNGSSGSRQRASRDYGFFRFCFGRCGLELGRWGDNQRMRPLLLELRASRPRVTGDER